MSEYLWEALRLLEDRDLARAEVRAKIEAAMESLQQGKGTDGDEFFDQMEAELEEIRVEEQEAKLQRAECC